MKLHKRKENCQLFKNICIGQRENIYCMIPLKSQGYFAMVAGITLKIHIGAFI